MVVSLVAHGACGGSIQKTADRWTDGLHLVFRRVPDGAVLLSVDLGSLREFDAEDLHRSGRVPEVLCSRCGQSGGGAVMVRYEHVFAEAEAIGGEDGFSDGRGVLVRVDISLEKLNPLFCPMGTPERGKGAEVLSRTYLYLTRPETPRERGLVLYSLGMSIRRENRDRANGHFLESVSLDPSLAGPNRFLAGYYLETGDYRSAIECYRRVVARVPKHERRAYEKVIEQWERVLSGEQVDEGETQDLYLE